MFRLWIDRGANKQGKIKIEQCRVRGKHRGFYVLRFPELEYTWAYYGEWLMDSPRVPSAGICLEMPSRRPLRIPNTI